MAWAGSSQHRNRIKLLCPRNNFERRLPRVTVVVTEEDDTSCGKSAHLPIVQLCAIWVVQVSYIQNPRRKALVTRSDALVPS